MHARARNLRVLPSRRQQPLLPCPLLAAVPLERWDVDAFAAASPNALEARFGSFIAGAQLFDAAVFGISRPEALYMDPQQRLLLHHAAEVLIWQGLASAGEPAPANLTRIGVMIGIGPTEYLGQAKDALPMGLYTATGAAISVAAGR